MKYTPTQCGTSPCTLACAGALCRFVVGGDAIEIEGNRHGATQRWDNNNARAHQTNNTQRGKWMGTQEEGQHERGMEG